MQRHVNLVDLVKSFPTNVYLQKSASTQPRTSFLTFARSPCTDPPGVGRRRTATTTWRIETGAAATGGTSTPVGRRGTLTTGEAMENPVSRTTSVRSISDHEQTTPTTRNSKNEKAMTNLLWSHQEASWEYSFHIVFMSELWFQ